jgi:putative ABC transport system ATP-binding protein
VPVGARHALIGPNGAGKSTLFQLLAGGLAPTAGRVWLDGRDVTRRSDAGRARLGIGQTFQHSSLFLSMTAAENVALALAFGGLRGAARQRRADELLSRVGLEERVNHRPAELSGGEQQRVAIARALANRPRLLLADEPTGNLDSTRAEDILLLLREMVEQDGLSILMVTHDHDIAARFAGRSISMRDGAVVREAGA